MTSNAKRLRKKSGSRADQNKNDNTQNHPIEASHMSDEEINELDNVKLTVDASESDFYESDDGSMAGSPHEPEQQSSDGELVDEQYDGEVFFNRKETLDDKVNRIKNDPQYWQILEQLAGNQVKSKKRSSKSKLAEVPIVVPDCNMELLMTKSPSDSTLYTRPQKGDRRK